MGGVAEITYPLRLKNWTAFSCRFAAVKLLNVPRFRGLPVAGLRLPGIKPIPARLQSSNHKSLQITY
jgi:hypothetical protein